MTKRNLQHVFMAVIAVLAIYFSYQNDQLKTENTKLKEQSTQVQGNYDFKADYSLTSK